MVWWRDDPRFERAESALHVLFDLHAREGKLAIPMTTEVYWGKV
jgi:hypothetical protein